MGSFDAFKKLIENIDEDNHFVPSNKPYYQVGYGNALWKNCLNPPQEFGLFHHRFHFLLLLNSFKLF